MMATTKTVTRTFKAPLERTPGKLHWVIIRVPLNVHKVWGKRGQLRVQGEINGFPFSSTLFPTGKGTHYMTVNRKLQCGAGVRPGMTARFRMEPDTAPRPVPKSGDLERVLRQSKELRRFFESLSLSTRREIARWIAGAKQEQTRRRRAERLGERLMETLEAEQELPPLLRIALSRNPRAQAAWQRMPPGKKRGQLLAIFYYRDPEARARRVQKTIEGMVAWEEARGL